MADDPDPLTRSESLDIQLLLHFEDLDSPVHHSSITGGRRVELRDRLAEVTGVRLEDESPELFPDHWEEDG